jgi:hypothetical protein
MWHSYRGSQALISTSCGIQFPGFFGTSFLPANSPGEKGSRTLAVQGLGSLPAHKNRRMPSLTIAERLEVERVQLAQKDAVSAFHQHVEKLLGL